MHLFAGETKPRSATAPRVQPRFKKPPLTNRDSLPVFNSGTSKNFSTVQPISDDPDHVMAQINRVSANLLDISLEGFSAFKTSLEYFVQLSEKMLQLIKAQSSSHFSSTKIAITLFKQRIADLKDLLEQIDSNLSYDRNKELDKCVKGIADLCMRIHDGQHSRK